MEFKYQKPEMLFKGGRIDVLSVEAEHPQGGSVRREVVAHPGAVVILPMLDSETVILIRNERFVVQQTLWELPAGTLEKGEEPDRCAARELQEETGYVATQILPLLNFFSTPGFCNEVLYVYHAHNLLHVGQSLDETEKIIVEAVRFSAALKMIQEGIIQDAKTICALLYFHTYCKNDFL